MRRYVAVRRTTRAEQRLEPLPAAVPKRAVLAEERDEAARAVHGEDLRRAGLRLISEREGQDHGAVFVPLAALDAYLLEAADPNDLCPALNVLDRDYLIVADTFLAVPSPPESADETVALAGWPGSGGIEEAWRGGCRGEGAVVGLFDTGCDPARLDAGDGVSAVVRVGAGMGPPEETVGFDEDGHGTDLVEIVAGSALGIAPQAEMMVASVAERAGMFTALSSVLVALDWFVERILYPPYLDTSAVLDLSPCFSPDCLEPSVRVATISAVQRVLRQVRDDFDVLTICAVGDDGPGSVSFPAALPEVLSVGAVDVEARPAPFSGGGFPPPPFDDRPRPDVVGYGVSVGSSSGTAAAAAFVAGIAALVASETGLTGAALRRHLAETALPLDAPSTLVGAGLARYDPA